MYALNTLYYMYPTMQCTQLPSVPSVMKELETILSMVFPKSVC